MSTYTPPQQLIVITADDPDAAPVGTWEAHYPGERRPFTVMLASEHGNVTGTFRIGRTSVDVFDGRLDAHTISFKAKSPNGGRTVTFTGTVQGGELVFTRDLELTLGRPPGQEGIFGAVGARTFSATRASASHHSSAT